MRQPEIGVIIWQLRFDDVGCAERIRRGSICLLREPQSQPERCFAKLCASRPTRTPKVMPTQNAWWGPDLNTTIAREHVSIAIPVSSRIDQSGFQRPPVSLSMGDGVGVASKFMTTDYPAD